MTVGAAPRSGRLPTLAKYEVLEELGHGGMATVYRAHDRRLGRDVAVKVIHPHLRDSREVAHRFIVEAQAVAKLRHPNIVEVFDVSSEDEPEQYLVVELLRGHDAAQAPPDERRAAAGGRRRARHRAARSARPRPRRRRRPPRHQARERLIEHRS